MRILRFVLVSVILSAYGADAALEIVTSVTFAEEVNATGIVTLGDELIEFPRKGTDETLLAVRFAGISLAKGTLINSAHIQFTASSTASTGDTTLVVRAELSSTPAALSATADDVSDRTLGSAQTLWSPPDWTVAEATTVNEKTSNLKPVVQQLVDQADWVSGGAMVFVLYKDDSEASPTAVRESNATLGAPFLLIDYKTGEDVLNGETISQIASDSKEWIDGNPALSGTLFGFLGLCVCALFGWLYYHHRKRKKGEILKKPAKKRDRKRKKGKLHIPNSLKDWEFPVALIMPQKKIGKGQFGVVMAATAYDIQGNKGPTQVALKQCNNENLSLEDSQEFIDEADIMAKFSDPYHPNIVRLLGIVTKTQPLTVIMEYLCNGDLERFLRKNRPVITRSTGPKITMRLRIRMATDIACGMKWLSSQGFVHRDLACRNCLVNDKLVIKISDFGMSKDCGGGEGFKKTGKMKLPVRWLAPECLVKGMFTDKSDVWAFGIAMWEIMTFADRPYPGMTNDQVMTEVIKGYRMPCPKNCPQEQFDIMFSCWHPDPQERPPFAALYETLKVLLPPGQRKSVRRPQSESNLGRGLNRRLSMESSRFGSPTSTIREKRGERQNTQWDFTNKLNNKLSNETDNGERQGLSHQSNVGLRRAMSEFSLNSNVQMENPEHKRQAKDLSRAVSNTALFNNNHPRRPSNTPRSESRTSVTLDRNLSQVSFTDPSGTSVLASKFTKRRDSESRAPPDLVGYARLDKQTRTSAARNPDNSDIDSSFTGDNHNFSRASTMRSQRSEAPPTYTMPPKYDKTSATDLLF